MSQIDYLLVVAVHRLVQSVVFLAQILQFRVDRCDRVVGVLLGISVLLGLGVVQGVGLVSARAETGAGVHVEGGLTRRLHHVLIYLLQSSLQSVLLADPLLNVLLLVVQHLLESLLLCNRVV